MNHNLTGSFGRIQLKPLRQEEIEFMRQLRNENRNWFFFSEEITIEGQKEWYSKYLENTDDIMFSVFLRNQIWIGSVALYSLDRGKGDAEFGRLMIDKNIDGAKGCGLDATIGTCQIGFEQIGLSEIKLEVYADNIPALKIYQRVGFQINSTKMITGREIVLMTLNKNMFAYKEKKMTIQVLKPHFHVEECLSEIRECLEKGWTGLGFKTVEFENKWKEYTGHPNAHFLNSATVGLHLAVEILKKENEWQNGDEIISSPITFVSTNHAILYEQLVPRFADVDEYLCLDPQDVERKINDRTRAVMFVGYGGRVGQLEKIIHICKAHKLKLILDAAHMSGTRVNGIVPGTWDGVDVTVYSYQAVKNLPTADSGMICFHSNKYDAICRKLTWLGINKDTYARTTDRGTYKWKYDVDYLGYKDHGNSIMAAIALVQLKYLNEDNDYRRKLVAIYDERFRGKKNIQIIDAPYKDECSYHIYEIAVPDREGLLNELASNDIFGGVHYRDNTEYEMYSYDHGTCPHAHEISQHLITLPLHLELTCDDIDMIAEIVIRYAGE